MTSIYISETLTYCVSAEDIRDMVEGLFGNGFETYCMGKYDIDRVTVMVSFVKHGLAIHCTEEEWDGCDDIEVAYIDNDGSLNWMWYGEPDYKVVEFEGEEYAIIENFYGPDPYDNNKYGEAIKRSTGRRVIVRWDITDPEGDTVKDIIDYYNPCSVELL